MIDVVEISKTYENLKEAVEELRHLEDEMLDWKAKAYAEHSKDINKYRTIEEREIAIANIFTEEDKFNELDVNLFSARTHYELCQIEVEKVRALIEFGVRYEDQ